VKHRLVTGICVVLLASIWALALRPEGAAARHASATTVVGIAPMGQVALEVVGREDQNGSAFITYGYLSMVTGLGPQQLYTSRTVHAEATARLTFVFNARLVNRSIIQNLIIADVMGTLAVHVSPFAGASFARPATFGHGSQVAAMTIRLQSVTNVQRPNHAVAELTADTRQISASSFVLGRSRYQFGRPGLLEHFTALGQATRTQPTIPKSYCVFGGAVTIAGP
jgi:hypothetical protein